MSHGSAFLSAALLASALLHLTPVAASTQAVDKSDQTESACIREAVPMKRYGEPSEVASLVAFLLSDEAAYISSSSYTIDGALYSN